MADLAYKITSVPDAAIHGTKYYAISISQPLLHVPAPILPPRTGAYALRRDKHHKVTFVQDDAFLVETNR